MIIQADRVENMAELATDVCIIGSGAAGITLALELRRHNVSAVVLTGGRLRETSRDRDLYRGAPDPECPHEPLEENRRRAFGGTTSAWGGRCVPLEPIDFDQRPWVPNSGWPISYGEVRPYFDRAMELCEAGPFSFDAADTFGPDRASMISGFDDDDITTSRLERWSPPTNFAKRYMTDLRRAPGLRVLVGGHATDIQLEGDGTSVRRVQATAGPGHSFFVAARLYVVAAGGLETPRLLLCSDEVHAKGIGNSADLVGRYYMSHLTGVAEKITMAEPRPELRSAFEKDADGVYCRRRFALTPHAQTIRQVGNAVATLHRPPISNAMHRDPLFSAAFLLKHYRGIVGRKKLDAILAELRESRDVQLEHLKVIAAISPASAAAILRVVRQRYFGKRRLPSVLAGPFAAEHYLSYQTEHAPNPASQVSLASERDALGMRRITVRPAFSDVDVRTVVELHRVIASRFEQSGIGTVVFDERELNDYLADYIRQFNSQAHHLGTARMSVTPASGVVDGNCKVHDVRDLFVAGAAVFPAGGHANPTLTIVALAVRLAGHLNERLRS